MAMHKSYMQSQQPPTQDGQDNAAFKCQQDMRDGALETALRLHFGTGSSFESCVSHQRSYYCGRLFLTSIWHGNFDNCYMVLNTASSIRFLHSVLCAQIAPAIWHAVIIPQPWPRNPYLPKDLMLDIRMPGDRARERERERARL